MKNAPKTRPAGLLHAALGLLAAIAMAAGPLSADSRTAAREVLDASGVRGGLVAHVGCGDGKLTASRPVVTAGYNQGIGQDSRDSR